MAVDTTEDLPRKIKTVSLRYAWVIVAINLAGTAFDFWYYIPQARLEPVLDSPIVSVRPALVSTQRSTT